MEEKDYIEELVVKNLEELNENEPLEGHFDRFSEKLKRQHKKKKITFNVVWKVAAVLIFVFLATNQLILYLSPTGSNEAPASLFTLSSVSDEYEEVEYYYTNAINTGLNQWNALKSEGLISEEEENMMKSELEEFEGLYNALQNDLAANPNDERVINAMLEYYQAKLSVINMIVNKLEEVKQLNKNQNVEI